MEPTLHKTTQDEYTLFFHMEGEKAERHGYIGYLRADYGRSGREFHTSWFDSQPGLKTQAFRDEFDGIINYLRDASIHPVEGPDIFRFNCLQTMRSTNFPVMDSDVRFKIVTGGYSYYFRCQPRVNDYNLYCMCFDNRFLLPEMEKLLALPRKCFSIHPETGERLLLRRGMNTMERFSNIEGPEELRRSVDRDNARWGVTPAQEAEMLKRALEGHGAPEATPRKKQKSEKEAR